MPLVQNQFSNLQKIMANSGGLNTAGQVQQQVNQSGQAQQQATQQANQNIGQHASFNAGDVQNQVAQGNWGALGNKINAQYTGPQAGSINVADRNVQKNLQSGQMLGSNAGQQQLLREQYGKGTEYTAGQNRYDNMLQNQNKDFQVQAAQTANAAKKQAQQADQANLALNQKAAGVEKTTREAAQNTRAELSNINQGITADVQSQVDAANKADQSVMDQASKIRNDIASGKVDAATLEAMGLSPDAITYGADLSKFINTQGGHANFNNMMNQDQFNKFSNISQLLGAQTGLDPSMVGGYQQASNMFDREGIAAAIAQGKQSYEDSFAAQRNALTGAQELDRKLWEIARMGPIDGKTGLPQDPQALAAYYGVANQYGLNRGGGLLKAMEWSRGDNLAKAQDAFDKAKAISDSQYLTRLGVK